MGLPESERSTIAFAAALHDMGALSVRERVSAMEFEVVQPHAHAEHGYSLLRTFAPLAKAADIIRLHHVHWDERLDSKLVEKASGNVPIGSYIVHISDRIAVLIDRERDALSQSGSIRDRIARESGAMFMPELVDVFEELANREYFWLDLSSPSVGSVLHKRMHKADVELDFDMLLSLADLFRRTIDFGSRFTATHSAGVAAVADHSRVETASPDVSASIWKSQDTCMISASWQYPPNCWRSQEDSVQVDDRIPLVLIDTNGRAVGGERLSAVIVGPSQQPNPATTRLSRPLSSATSLPRQQLIPITAQQDLDQARAAFFGSDSSIPSTCSISVTHATTATGRCSRSC